MSNLLEKLTASDPAGKWIEDFIKSDDPRFKGKSKEERKEMALGAYYAKVRESVDLLEYTIEKVKNGVRVVHDGKIVHTAGDAEAAQSWIAHNSKKRMGEAVEGEYGDVDYADKKNKKYPVDTEEHIRAAWSYIHMPKNQKEYSDSEVATIKSHIESAWKEKIDKSGPPEGKAMSENFMDATLAQDYVTAEFHFKQMMAEKAAQYMEQRKQEIASTMASESVVNESMKLLSSHKSDCGRHEAKVYKDSEYNEHRVKFYTDGKHRKDADYHTDDKSDAEGTAKAELKKMK